MKKKIIVIVLGIAGILVLKLLSSSDSDTSENTKQTEQSNQSNENQNNMSEQTNDKQHSEKVSIGFYNVENLFDTYDDPKTHDEDFTPYGKLKWDDVRYDKKLEDISDVISAMDAGNGPAFLGLAEVENYDVLKDLIKTGDLKKSPYKVIHRDNNDSRGIDVAAIYRSDIFEEVDYSYYTVPKLHTRDILYVKGKLYNQETIHYFVTHFPSRRKGTEESEYKRIQVAKLLRSKIDDLLDRNPDERIIIMGDFNDEPSDNSVAKHLMQSEFYNLHKQFEDKSNNGTVNHRGDWLVFDQIIVSKSLLDDKTHNLTKKSGFIYNDESVTFTYYDGNKVPSRTYGGPEYHGGTSDHYAVYLKMVVKY
jgi:predicted extracellular nuclease